MKELFKSIFGFFTGGFGGIAVYIAVGAALIGGGFFVGVRFEQGNKNEAMIASLNAQIAGIKADYKKAIESETALLKATGAEEAAARVITRDIVKYRDTPASKAPIDNDWRCIHNRAADPTYICKGATK